MSQKLVKLILAISLIFIASGPLAAQSESRVTSQIQASASGNLSAHQVELLVKRFAGRPHKSFKDFCLSVYSSSRLTLTNNQREALGNFAARQELTGSQREIVFRVLGLYAQLKYGGEALLALKGLIETRTLTSSSSKFNRAKQFSAASALLKKKSKKFGLKFSSLGGRAYQIDFPWRKPKGASLAIYTHLDVAPANPNQWRLKGGKSIDPFTLTRGGTKLYGRGARSNKNGIVAAMFAMRVIVDEKIRLFNDIKLIIDTQRLGNERQAIDSYFTQSTGASALIALDGIYPDKKSADGINRLLARALVNVATESLDLQPVATAQPSKSPTSLQFGMLMPGQENLSAEPLEYKELEEFLLDLQMVTEMMVRVGQMRRLD